MKAYFLSRHIREKILMLGFIALGLGMWLTRLIGQTNTLLSETKTITTTLATQDEVLAQREETDIKQANAIQALDPAKSFDSLGLQSKLDEIARKVNLNQNGQQNTNINQTIVKTLPLMIVTQLRLQLNNIEMQDLVNFYRELQTVSPYISIAAFRIQASNRGGNGRGNNNNNPTDTNPQPVTRGGPGGAIAVTNPNGGNPFRGGGQRVTPGSRLTATIDLMAVKLRTAAAAPAAAAPKPAAAPAVAPAATPATAPKA